MRTVHNLVTPGYRLESEYPDTDDDPVQRYCSVFTPERRVVSFEVTPTPCCGLDTVHNFWLQGAQNLTPADWCEVFTFLARDLSTSGFQFVFISYDNDGVIMYSDWLQKLRILGAHVARPYINDNTGNALYVTTLPVPGMERRLKAYERRMAKQRAAVAHVERFHGGAA